VAPLSKTPPVPAATDPAIIRNFCIIAHIDHGKSTLADRMLQATGVVAPRDMKAQYLDRMDIERERGITIKSQAVRMPWEVEGTSYALNMIDTPGHVDFTYEVSRSLAACEGALLLVDAAQGIEAQTLANLYLAMENDLTIIPVLNKIDLPAAMPDKYAEELAHLIGCEPDEVLRVSGKTGEGVEALLDRIVEGIPAPEGTADAPARAMIFDSVYDSYRGVVTYVRVVDGRLEPRQKIKMMSTGAEHDLLEIGVISPEPIPSKGLSVGEVGYLITGVKDVRQSRVGDTVTSAHKPAEESLGGYEFRLQELREVPGPNYQAVQAKVEVSRDGRFHSMLLPEKRAYSGAMGSTQTEAAIETRLTGDVYVALGERLPDGRWTMLVWIKPFVDWIWGGCVLMALGGFIAMADRRYRRQRAHGRRD